MPNPSMPLSFTLRPADVEPRGNSRAADNDAFEPELTRKISQLEKDSNSRPAAASRETASANARKAQEAAQDSKVQADKIQADKSEAEKGESDKTDIAEKTQAAPSLKAKPRSDETGKTLPRKKTDAPQDATAAAVQPQPGVDQPAPKVVDTAMLDSSGLVSPNAMQGQAGLAVPALLKEFHDFFTLDQTGAPPVELSDEQLQALSSFLGIPKPMLAAQWQAMQNGAGEAAAINLPALPVMRRGPIETAAILPVNQPPSAQEQLELEALKQAFNQQLAKNPAPAATASALPKKAEPASVKAESLDITTPLQVEKPTTPLLQPVAQPALAPVRPENAELIKIAAKNQQEENDAAQAANSAPPSQVQATPLFGQKTPELSLPGTAPHVAANLHAAPVPTALHEQVSLQIGKASEEGLNRMTIRLDPAELGKVEVKLDISKDGVTQVMMQVESKETLDLLQRDSRELQRSLQQLGLNMDGSSMSFNLKERHGDNAPRQQAKQRGGVPVVEETAPPSHARRYYEIRSNDGLNIQV